jgi:hypothetical protein
MRTKKHSAFWLEKGRALRAHNLLKQKRVDCIVVSSKLHVSERSTAPCIVSTSQPPAGRPILATLSQHRSIPAASHTRKTRPGGTLSSERGGRTRTEILGNDEVRMNQPRLSSKDMDSGSFATTSIWIERTQWQSIYKSARRDILRALTRLPDRHALKVDYVLGQGSHESSPDVTSLSEVEQKISCILGALDSVVDRCENTTRRTSRFLSINLVWKSGSGSIGRRVWSC